MPDQHPEYAGRIAAQVLAGVLVVFMVISAVLLRWTDASLDPARQTYLFAPTCATGCAAIA